MARRRAGRSSTPRSTPASTCSTPPTSTATPAAPRSSSGELLDEPPRRGRASPPSSAATCGAPTVPTGARAARGATSAGRSRQSLRRLRTDWIDLYQLHRPDRATPDRGDARRARRAGARGQGPLHRLLQPRRLADRRRGLGGPHRGLDAVHQRPEPVQPARPRGRDRGRARPASTTAWACCPFFPLASGLLTGKYRRGASAAGGHPAGRAAGAARRRADFDVIETLQTFADERAITLLDVAIGGLAAQPAVGSVIAGATTAEQVQGQRRRPGVVADRGRPADADGAHRLIHDGSSAHTGTENPDQSEGRTPPNIRM